MIINKAVTVLGVDLEGTKYIKTLECDELPRIGSWVWVYCNHVNGLVHIQITDHIKVIEYVET